MNKSVFSLFLISTIIFLSCQKEEILEPFDYPGLLANSVERVEIFDDGTILTLSNEGIFFKRPMSSGNTFRENNFQLSSYDAFRMRFFLTESGEIYGVNNQYVMVIDNSGFNFYTQNVLTLNGYLSSAGFGLSPDDKLLRLDYSTEKYDSASNSYVYHLRISEWENEKWYSEETEIISALSSTDKTPSIVFDNNTAYIVTTKIYEADFDEIYNLDPEELVPVNSTSDIVMNELRFYNKTIMGFGQSVNPFDSYPRNIYSSSSVSITSGRLSSDDFSNCADSDYGLSVDDFIGYHEENSIFFQEESYNWFTSDNTRGDLVFFDMLKGKCESQSILAINDFDDGSLSINDVSMDFKSDMLYLATNSGLYMYDLSTNLPTRYLDYLIDEGKDE